jgi:hypothetical protein
MDNDLLFEIENFKNMFNSSLNKSEREIHNTPKNITSDEQDASLLFPSFIEFINLVKSTFGFINSNF